MSTQTISTIRDPLAEGIKTAITGLVDANIDGIANEVANAEDGKLSVAFSVKLTLEGLRVAGVGSLSHSRKFKDEAEFITPDPEQMGLPGVELTAEMECGHTSKADAASLRKGLQAVEMALAAGWTPEEVSAAIDEIKAYKYGIRTADETVEKEGGAS